MRDTFNEWLQLPIGELTWELPVRKLPLLEDIGYLINPRRLRGSDFLMRWSQGRWSEEVVIRTINATKELGAIPYGPSTVAPDDPQELERFFEVMDRILEEGKRPDALLFDRASYEWARKVVVNRLGNAEMVARTPSTQIRDVISKARVALEIENSLWHCEKMPGFGKPFSRFIRGKHKGRLKPAGIIPTIIVKKEDISGLQKWEADFGVPIVVVHVFYDRGFFIRFREIIRLLDSGDVGFEPQKFTNPDGTAATPKDIIKIPYVLCKPFGIVRNQQLVPKTFIDKNGKVMTYATFVGGDISLSQEFVEEFAK
jgi:hypothetical protein